MLALKDILAGKTGTSPLAGSPMWTQPVDRITPSQLAAFVARQKALGKRDEAESAIDIALTAITRAVGNNELPVPQMLSYHRPQRVVMTTTELKDGLLQLGEPKAPAVLFALETGLDSVEVSRLTHRSLATLRAKQTLSPIAEECLSSAPARHINLQYVFWRDSGSGFPLPLFGLEADVFNAFGLVWGELAQGYENLITA